MVKILKLGQRQSYGQKIKGASVCVADANPIVCYQRCCSRASVHTDSLLQRFVNIRGWCYGQMQGGL